MSQLAQIRLLDGSLLEVHWNASTKSITYWQGKHPIEVQDERIGTTLTRILDRQEDQLAVSELYYFEYPGIPIPAHTQMKQDLLECTWSDYANDNMLFQCSLQLVKRD